MVKWWFLPLLLIGCLSTRAQDISSIRAEARLAARSGNWEKLRDLLKPHLFPPPDDPVAAEWFRLYALSLIRTGDLVSAGVSLDRLETDYASSPDSLETVSLRGEWLWKKNRLSQALEKWSRLPARYDNRIRGIVSARNLPPDSLFLLQPGEKLQARRVSWSGDNTQAGRNTERRPLRVGLVLPLGLNKSDPLTRASPLMDFYRGFSLGHEVLTASDSGFDYQVFDYSDSEAEIRRMIQKQAFSGLDLVVGPVKASPTPLLIADASQKGYALWNPLGHTAQNTGYKGFFQGQPSHTTLAAKIFDFASPLSPGRGVAIVYGVEKSDSLLAASYRDQVRKMGKQVLLFRKVGKNSAANLVKYLVESGLDSTGHLLVASNEPLVRIQLLSAYGWTKARYPVVVFGKWLEAQDTDFEEYERWPFYFAEPDLVSDRSARFRGWEGAYLSKWGRPPTWLSWKGFDLACLLGTGLYGKTGPEIRRPLVAAGFTSEGFHFGEETPDNLVVPVYRFDSGRLNRVWPEEK